MCEVGMARSDGRTGINGTLHRVAAVTNRYGVLTGYTIRIGRHIADVAEPLREVLLEPKTSIALFGPPGSGKSTLVRSATTLIAKEIGPRLCVVDASNEIAGDGDTPHPLLGAGRRLQVSDPKELAAKLTEGLINHGPAVMIVDELARPEEVIQHHPHHPARCASDRLFAWRHFGRGCAQSGLRAAFGIAGTAAHVPPRSLPPLLNLGTGVATASMGF